MYRICEYYTGKKTVHPIHLAAGIINPDDSAYILWEYALYGSDIGGSKNWLHDANYITQTKKLYKYYIWDYRAIKLAAIKGAVYIIII